MSSESVWPLVLKRTLPGSAPGGAFVPSAVLCFNGSDRPLEVRSRPAVVFQGSRPWAAAWRRPDFSGRRRRWSESLLPGEVATLQEPGNSGGETSRLEVRVSGDHAGQ